MPVTCSARGRGNDGSEVNYYELLGVEPDCSMDDIKVAFRRRAKELHPDVNPEDDAESSFVALSRAYEVLSDEEARREYDLTHRTRRINFFQDIEDDDDEAYRPSPFRWANVGHRGRSAARPGDDDDDSDEEGQAQGEGGRRGAGDGGRDDGEEDPRWRQGERSPEELLENLARFMNGPGGLRAFQSGRLDPWGTSTSDAWHRAVERQTRDPYGPGRPGYGAGPFGPDDDDELGRSEWDPSRRVPGWTPPGRGSEWSHPRRQWDDEDRRSGGPGGPGRQGGGGGGDFRRPFKI